MPIHSRRVLFAVAAILAVSSRASADERQVRGFIGATFGGGSTNIVDPAGTRNKTNVVVGGSAVFLGDMFGVEADVGDMPGFFKSGNSPLVINSRVSTFTGNVVIAAPRRLTEYSLRPYIVGGGGLMRMRTTTAQNVFDVSTFFPAIDVGAGVVGFLTNRAGVCWEIRRFQNISNGFGSDVDNGLSFDEKQKLSFWRATMSVVFRY